MSTADMGRSRAITARPASQQSLLAFDWCPSMLYPQLRAVLSRRTARQLIRKLHENRFRLRHTYAVLPQCRCALVIGKTPTSDWTVFCRLIV